MGGTGVVDSPESKRQNVHTIPDVKGRSVLFSMEDKEQQQQQKKIGFIELKRMYKT